MALHQHTRELLLKRLHTAQADEANQLNNALRLLSKWRAVLIQNTLIQQHGTKVLQGPLQGMDFIQESAEGCHIPKLLGSYEQPLQPHVERAIQTSYDAILNIGCAEGYYAVGMARRMPHTRIEAHDLSENAQKICRELAEKNAVADRVHIGGLFRAGDFAAFSGKRTLVFCDIEGAERELLDPVRVPALLNMDLIVEAHECLIPGVTRSLAERFKNTHTITLVEDDGQRTLPNAPSWFRNMQHLDQLLAVWEWRSGPTPWLVMHAREAQS